MLLYTLIDGLADRPNPELNGLTPLEAASTPNLDSLARRGAMGLVHPVGGNIAPESDIAVFSMLGYDFPQGYFGRGVVEALGLGMDFSDGELALRGNFVSLTDDGEILDRRVGRSVTDEEGKKLAEYLNRSVRFSDSNIHFSIKHGLSHRVAVVFGHNNQGLSSNITNTDPAYGKVKGMGVARKPKRMMLMKSKSLDQDISPMLSARIVNEFTEKVIERMREHPINLARKAQGKLPISAIALRDASSHLPHLPTITERFGVKAAAVVEMPVEKGVSRITGMECYEVRGGKFASIAKKVEELVDDIDMLYVHIKGPDEPGHDGDPKRKKESIQKIDEEFFGRIISLDLRKNTVAISADHATPCTLRSHGSDPVPLLVLGGKIQPNEICRFTEVRAKKGTLGTLKGKDVLSFLFSLVKD